MVILGAGLGLSFVPVTIAGTSGVAPEDSGLASGLLNTSQQLGAALGLAIFSALATSRTNDLLAARTPAPQALTEGFQRALLASSLFLVAAAVAGLKRILDSPFGAVLQAIRENSERASACGYDIGRVKLLSFVFSALFAGLAGSLDALRLNVVPIESLYWTTSGQVVIMTLLGGAGTFFGPFVGAATVLVLEDRVAVVTESWPLVIGAIFMAFVLFLPKGLWGTVLTRFEHL
jgi:ABC-type branched-subunit amino acid transport system permease subunit